MTKVEEMIKYYEEELSISIIRKTCLDLYVKIQELVTSNDAEWDMRMEAMSVIIDYLRKADNEYLEKKGTKND